MSYFRRDQLGGEIKKLESNVLEISGTVIYLDSEWDAWKAAWSRTNHCVVCIAKDIESDDEDNPDLCTFFIFGEDEVYDCPGEVSFMTAAIKGSDPMLSCAPVEARRAHGEW